MGKPVSAKLASLLGTGKAVDKMLSEWVWPAGLWRLRAAGCPTAFSARSQVPFVFFGRDSHVASPFLSCPTSPLAGALARQEGGSPEWPAHSFFFFLPAGRVTEIWLEFAQRTSHDLTGTRTSFLTATALGTEPGHGLPDVGHLPGPLGTGPVPSMVPTGHVPGDNAPTPRRCGPGPAHLWGAPS